MNKNLPQPQADIIIAEFSKLREEIHQCEATLLQVLVLVIASLTVIIPALFNNLDNIPPELLVLLLTLLTLLYSAMTMNYSYNANSVFLIGFYIRDYLRPLANELFPLENTNLELFHWEEYMKYQRTKISVMLPGAGLSITAILTILPSMICLPLLYYVISELFTDHENLLVNYIYNYRYFMFGVSLVVFCFSVITIMVTMYNIIKSIFAEKPINKSIL